MLFNELVRALFVGGHVGDLDGAGAGDDHAAGGDECRAVGGLGLLHGSASDWLWRGGRCRSRVDLVRRRFLFFLRS